MTKKKSKKKPIGEKKPVGRPPVVTPEVIALLEDSFLLGASDQFAFRRAGISKDAFYNYLKDNPEFKDRIEMLKATPGYNALINVNKDLKAGDIDTSKWYLERRMKDDFSARQEVTGKDGKAIGNPYENLTDDELERELNKRLCETEKQP